MGNEGFILAGVGIAVVIGAYLLNLGGIKDKINSLLAGPGKPQCMALGLCVQGMKWDATACKCVPANQGIAVGEFNPAIPCPKGQVLTTGGCAPAAKDPCGPNAHGVIKTGKGLVCVPN